ncbi:MAG: ABC transporter ATP-binding protein, partial [Cyanobacteria bacterium P01_F01_bin.33]
LALALAQTPTVLLLDEPTTYLDLHFQLELLDFIKRLQHQRQLAVVTVLHDINLAARYSDRLAMLRSGSLYAIGTPCEVITPVHLAAVFNIEAEVLSTARGLQIFPIAACSSDAASTQPQVPLVNSAS